MPATYWLLLTPEWQGIEPEAGVGIGFAYQACNGKGSDWPTSALTSEIPLTKPPDYELTSSPGSRPTPKPAARVKGEQGDPPVRESLAEMVCSLGAEQCSSCAIRSVVILKQVACICQECSQVVKLVTYDAEFHLARSANSPRD
jgi:hypothetical protein